MLFLSVRIKRSTSPFARGHRGVTRWLLNPTLCANSLNSLLLNGGPLSEHTVSGTPNSAKILLRDVSRLSMTLSWLLQQLGISCSHRKQRASILLQTVLWSPPTSFQGPSGSGDIRSGSRFVSGVVAWHARQDLTFFSTALSIPANQTFSRSRDFAFAIPGGPHEQRQSHAAAWFRGWHSLFLAGWCSV